MEDDRTYEIAVTGVGDSAATWGGHLREAIEATLRRHGVPAARIGVALLDDPHIARLNEKHLKRTGPTDVLAFNLRIGSPSPDEGEALMEGEIAVSVDAAAREASNGGHSIEAELALYVVHGTLHLLGYGDHTEGATARMHELEDEILTEMGVGPVYRRVPP